jgi:hypothetical protein
MSRHLLFDGLLILTCAYALLRGGAPERIVAATLALGDLATILVASRFALRFRSEEIGIFLVDLVILLILGAVALRSMRWWPLWLAAFQLDAVAVHVVRLTAPATLPMSYMNAIALWAWPMQLLLAYGAWEHRRRLRRFGSDPAWLPARTALRSG